MAEIKQRADGALVVYQEQDQKPVTIAGGPKTPVAVAQGSQPLTTIQGNANFRSEIVANIPFQGVTASPFTAGILNVQLDPANDVVISEVAINILTTAPVCTIDVGCGTTAGIQYNNLINGLVTTTPGLFNNITNSGTSGTTRQYLAAGGYISITPQSATCALLTGNLFVHYHTV